MTRGNGVDGSEAGATGFPFRFTGQKLDPETGLYYYKARYYDPETGRFLQTDPIGYEDQMNLYAYVANDPINATGPTGMDSALRNRAAIRGEEYEHPKCQNRSVCDATFIVLTLFLPGPEDAILAVAGVRLVSTRFVVAGIRSQLKKGKRLVLYSGKTPELRKDEFAFRTRDLFWTKGVNDKVIKEAIRAKQPIRDSH